MEKIIASLTFDDGWKSQYQQALPILNKYRYKGTFFIETQYLSKHSLSRMNVADIKYLSNAGHEIGAHSVTHPYAWEFWKWNEVKQSKIDLESILETRIEGYAYPFGRYNHSLVARVREAGYTCARMVNGQYNGFNWHMRDSWKIEGKAVTARTTKAHIAQWIRESIENDFWLVFVFHQVQENHSKWGCKPYMLEYVCSQLEQHSCIVLPMTRAQERYK